MKKNKLILSFIIIASSVCSAQTASLVAESKRNLCLLNHEVVDSSLSSSFLTQKVSYGYISSALFPEAIFLDNFSKKLIIAPNADAFYSPQYGTVAPIFSSSKYGFGNAVAADLNSDSKIDILSSNQNGDIYKSRSLGGFSYTTDSMLYTLTPMGHNARICLTNVDNNAFPDLFSIGAYTTFPFGYYYNLYKNTSVASGTLLSFATLTTGYTATLSSTPNDNFSVASYDLNHDGTDEILFVSEATTSSVTILWNLFGNLNQKFVGGVSTPGLINKKIDASDINKDGQPEIQVLGSVGAGLSYVYILSPSFTSSVLSGVNQQTTVIIPNNISDFVFVDMNQDSLRDLVVSVANTGSVLVYIQNNHPSFSFLPPVAFNLTNHTTGGLAAFDVDDNKIPDIISFLSGSPTNSIASSMAVLKNFTYRDSLIAIPNKTILCPGESIIIENDLLSYTQGFGYYSPYSPTVMAHAPSHTITVNSAGVYSSTATYSTFLVPPLVPVSAGSCIVSSNTIQINVGVTPTISISSPTSLCSGQTATIGASGANSLTWTTGQTNTTEIVVTPTVDLILVVSGTSTDGCIGYSANDTIRIHPDINANVTSDKNLLCRNERATFTATGGQTYLWSTGQITPVISVTQTLTVSQTYTVLVSGAGNCVKVVSVQTVFSDKCNEVVIKNGITPNGDGSNDYLYIENIDRYPNNQVNIFNRWGVELFSAKGYDNVTNAWPAAAVKLTPGTYFYIVDLGNGDPIKKGWLEILSN